MSGADSASKRAASDAPTTRRILFLQGPLSPLFRLIGEHLRTVGMSVFRINFCSGDWLHWHGDGCSSFKGKPEEWPDFIEAYLVRNQITDLVVHGDQRLYHRIAIAKARDLGAYVSATELGALRPGWMTLERNGLSTLSHFPDDPVAIRNIAERAGAVDVSPRFPSSFWLQTGPDVIYNLANVFLKVFYPRYQRHTIYPPVSEYVRGAARLWQQKKRDKRADDTICQVQASGKRYFVLPIQLEGDFQLRRHSPYDSFTQVLDTVFRSLAEVAPNDTQLVLKSHPLDVGFESWPDVSLKLAKEHGLERRVHYLDGGGLAKPLERASGIVTLNSTAGLEALQAGVPVKTLVPAHFDIAGLTHQGTLDTFWTDPVKPDADLLAAYVTALAATTQVRGTIHNRDGVAVAAKNMAEWIAAQALNPLGAFVDPPPRLAKARKIGVPL